MAAISLAQLQREVKAQGDAQRAIHDKAYHKTSLTCWGVTAVRSKQLSRKFKEAFLLCGARQQRKLLDQLWSSEVLDLRMIALGLWQYMARQELFASDWKHAMRWAGSATGWAELDTIASRCVGPLLLAFPQHYRALRKLSWHRNLWLRRLSILGHLLPFRKEQGQWSELRDTMSELLQDKNFFIRKAIGWQLREISTRQPELTIAFVEAHADRMSGLSYREATRRLDAASRRRLDRSRPR